MPSTIWTIGHSHHPLETLCNLLAEHQIELLVDVRSDPYSRYASQFNRQTLSTALPGRGVRYLFLGDLLGGRAEDPQFYDDEGHVRYDRLAESPGFRQGIERLLAGIGQFRAAILCSEEDPAHCHRRLLIGRVLTERGHTMLHIRGDGSLESDETVAAQAGKPLIGAQPALFAELDEDQWRSTASVLPKKAPESFSAH